MEPAIEKVAETAYYIATTKVLLKHDLMGRVYHTLLFEKLAKHLATYYTAVTSARLLAHLAVASPCANWSEKDLSDIDEIRKLRVCDFACGSGTLLSAVYGELERLYLDQCSSAGKDPDLVGFHTALLDDVLTGFDVMLYAAHIATLTLAMHNPDAIFREGQIYVLPFGDRNKSTGSIEYLVKDSVRAKTTATRTGVTARKAVEVKPPTEGYDLIIMNPPFARSSGEVNLLFGSVTDEKLRQSMLQRLAEILSDCRATGIGHAGLGAVFVYLSDKHVKPGGRIAFVLPRNLLSGVSWEKVRRLLIKTTQLTAWPSAGFHLEHVMVSVERHGYNFSENTDLSECMFVARKLREGEEPGKTLFTIIYGKPRTVFEARDFALAMSALLKHIQNAPIADILTSPMGQAQKLGPGNGVIGRSYSVEPDLLKDNVDNWGRLCAFAVPELTRYAYRLRTTGELYTNGIRTRFPLKPIAKMFEVGPDRRQIQELFIQGKSGQYDALWGRKAEMNVLLQMPNEKLTPKPNARFRSLLKYESTLLLAERVRLTTTPLFCVTCVNPVLANMWWELKSRVSNSTIVALDAVFAIWLNSTMGILLYLLEQYATAGPWTGIKKAPLEALPALDICKLTDSQKQELLKLYDYLKDKEWPVLPAQFKEAAEGKGWRFELDSRLLEILSGQKITPRDLKPLYDLLVQESEHW